MEELLPISREEIYAVGRRGRREGYFCVRYGFSGEAEGRAVGRGARKPTCMRLRSMAGEIDRDGSFASNLERRSYRGTHPCVESRPHARWFRQHGEPTTTPSPPVVCSVWGLGGPLWRAAVR